MATIKCDSIDQKCLSWNCRKREMVKSMLGYLVTFSIVFVDFHAVKMLYIFWKFGLLWIGSHIWIKTLRWL